MAFDRLDSVGLTYLWSKIKGIFATKSQVGDTAMGTTATTVTGAIKEHQDKIGNTSMGTTATTLTGAIAEHETDINNLNSNSTINATKSGSKWTSGDINIYKYGNIVEIQFANLTTDAITTRTTIATIPSGYRPPVQSYCLPVLDDTGSYIVINTNGTIQIDRTANKLYGCVTYPAWQ